MRKIRTVKPLTKPVSRAQKLVRALRAADPDIIEIVQFGSSVYAPRLARDVDLFVLTRAKKEYDVYLDAVMDWHKDVDVIVKSPGEQIGERIVLGLLASGRTLFGDGLARKEAQKNMPVPTFAQARYSLKLGDEMVERVQVEKDEVYRKARYQAAFDHLFDGARYAAMTFIVTDETKWGKLPDKLPKPFNTQFREFISKLHVQFKYDAVFNLDQADELYQTWRAKVETFIAELETRSPSAPGKSS